MHLTKKALWFLESHLRESVSLDDVASFVGVSRFHLIRTFGLTQGQSVMRYHRGRRLTEAARQLKHGKNDILSLALEYGYASQQAFTRAFKDQFGITPGAFRKSPELSKLLLVEPRHMTPSLSGTIMPNRFETTDILKLACISQAYDTGTELVGIPDQWQTAMSYASAFPYLLSGPRYGVCDMNEETRIMTYSCGFAIDKGMDIPPEMDAQTIQPAEYAVFRHNGHVSLISETFEAIFELWLPNSPYEPTGAPELEVYSEDFNPFSETGFVEIWVPVKERV